jgi:hypothetical protein
MTEAGRPNHLTQICYLKETHFKCNEICRLEAKRMKKIHHTNINQMNKKVATFIIIVVILFCGTGV